MTNKNCVQLHAQQEGLDQQFWKTTKDCISVHDRDNF